MLIHCFKILGEKDEIYIEDNIILYICGTLKWIDTYNDEKLLQLNKGINYYGITYFDVKGIIHLKKILLGWKKLFQKAPSYFRLTGLFSFNINKRERIPYLKQELLSQLNSLINLCEIAIKQEKIIYHGGI